MQIKRHGIIWEIEGNVPTSTYINGDYCVPAGTKVLAVLAEDGTPTTGSQVNPKPGVKGQPSWNSIVPPSIFPDMSVHYDASLAVHFPFILQDGMSLVSVVQKQGATPPISHAAVLTATSTLPAPGEQFRPAYAGLTKAPKKMASELKNPCPVIPDPMVGGSPWQFDINKINKVWLDFISDWAGQYIHPSNNMPAYGRDIATLVGDAALALCFASDPVVKRELLVNLCQIGIDMYGLYINGQYWNDGGGHSHGRRTPIIIAGLAFNDPGMLMLETGRFGEGHTFFVSRTGSTINNGYGGYTAEHVGTPEWGFRHGDTPSLDTVAWDPGVTPYRFCCTANSWTGQVTALRLMGALKAFGIPAWAPYMDRYIRKCKADGSPSWFLDWSGGRHLECWDKFRVQDAPATQSIGYGTHYLMSDIPPLVGQNCTVRLRGPYHPNCHVILALSKTKLIPNEGPPVPLPPGTSFKGFNYLDGIDVMVSFMHTSNQTTYNVPMMPHNLPGTGFTLQAYILGEGGVFTASNALELIVQDPNKPPVLG